MHTGDAVWQPQVTRLAQLAFGLKSLQQSVRASPLSLANQRDKIVFVDNGGERAPTFRLTRLVITRMTSRMLLRVHTLRDRSNRTPT
jgi:hypothetical protein